MYEFYQDNKAYCISLFITFFVCAIGIWLVYDHGRNEQIQDDTDSTVGVIDQRIENAAGRLDQAAGNITEAEQAIQGAAGSLERGTAAAAEITGGINECQAIIERCVQRSGRIQNIINDIEAANR